MIATELTGHGGSPPAGGADWMARGLHMTTASRIEMPVPVGCRSVVRQWWDVS